MRSVDPGAVMSAARCLHLAQLWYRGRMELNWERQTVDEMEKIFQEAGLTERFWNLR